MYHSVTVVLSYIYSDIFSPHVLIELYGNIVVFVLKIIVYVIDTYDHDDI